MSVVGCRRAFFDWKGWADDTVSDETGASHPRKSANDGAHGENDDNGYCCPTDASPTLEVTDSRLTGRQTIFFPLRPA